MGSLDSREEILRELSKRKVIQVALDFTKVEEALPVALASIKAGVGIVEAGTPLIKSEGVKGLRILRSISEGKPILADTKTADAGDVEALIACEGGASIMTVLGAMDDATISLAVSKARELGLLVQVDLINVPDPVSRARKVSELGADIIGLHVGLDVQRSRGINVSLMRKEIQEISSTGSLLSIAGGLNKDRISGMLDLPINIYVVGGAITRSTDPYTSAKELVSLVSK